MLLKESTQDAEYPGAVPRMIKKGIEISLNKRMYSCKKEADAPRSKTIIHFYKEVCAAEVQCYFRFSETSQRG